MRISSSSTDRKCKATPLRGTFPFATRLLGHSSTRTEKNWFVAVTSRRARRSGPMTVARFNASSPSELTGCYAARLALRCIVDGRPSGLCRRRRLRRGRHDGDCNHEDRFAHDASRNGSVQRSQHGRAGIRRQPTITRSCGPLQACRARLTFQKQAPSFARTSTTRS